MVEITSFISILVNLPSLFPTLPVTTWSLTQDHRHGWQGYDFFKLLHSLLNVFFSLLAVSFVLIFNIGFCTIISTLHEVKTPEIFPEALLFHLQNRQMDFETELFFLWLIQEKLYFNKRLSSPESHTKGESAVNYREL